MSKINTYNHFSLNKFIITLLISLLFIPALAAQKVVAFDKRGKVKRIRFYEGQFIHLKLKSRSIAKGIIHSIADSSFMVDNKLIHRDSVKFVYVTKNKPLLNGFSSLFITSGLFYFAGTAVNRTINNDSPIIFEDNAKISLSLVGTGILLKQLTKRRYKISPKRPLKIIDFGI